MPAFASFPWSRVVRLLVLMASPAAALLAAVPPVPVPPENPMTEEKRVLGKILFWDEQLSSDDTIACGTCHRPAFGGADPRSGRHHGRGQGHDRRRARLARHREPGSRRPPDVAHDLRRSTASHPAPQRRRTSGPCGPSELSWDGRAGTRFMDPLTGATLIARGGALENQALSALSLHGDGERGALGPR